MLRPCRCLVALAPLLVWALPAGAGLLAHAGLTTPTTAILWMLAGLAALSAAVVADQAGALGPAAEAPFPNLAPSLPGDRSPRARRGATLSAEAGDPSGPSRR